MALDAVSARRERRGHAGILGVARGADRVRAGHERPRAVEVQAQIGDAERDGDALARTGGELDLREAAELEGRALDAAGASGRRDVELHGLDRGDRGWIMRPTKHIESEAGHTGIDLAPMLDFVLNLLISFLITP